MDDELIALFGDEPKLMPYLHLPFQAGSDRILKAMNRKHSIADYEDVIAKVRAARPDIALSTDIIVGFPGETDQDFEATMALAARANFAQAFTFKYSARPGTPAASLERQVPEQVKRERLYAVQSLIDGQRRAFDRATVGRRARRAVRGPRAETRSALRAFTLSPGGACGGIRGADRPDCRG